MCPGKEPRIKENWYCCPGNQTAGVGKYADDWTALLVIMSKGWMTRCIDLYRTIPVITQVIVSATATPMISVKDLIDSKRKYMLLYYRQVVMTKFTACIRSCIM